MGQEGSRKMWVSKLAPLHSDMYSKLGERHNKDGVHFI